MGLKPRMHCILNIGYPGLQPGVKGIQISIYCPGFSPESNSYRLRVFAW